MSYEVDTEITNLLVDSAPADDDLVWSMTPLIGVSVQEHYASFVQVIEKARQKVYKRTRRFNPNYMLVSPDLIPVLTMIPTFNRSNDSTFNGPYFVGTLPGLKVYVTPNIADGHFVLGVNGGSVETSAAVYAPYMPIVPTMALGFADGGIEQGFSTAYDLKLITSDFLIAGRITA